MLQATSEATARFGAVDWDYLHLELAADLAAGDQISTAVLIDAGNEGGGVRFILSRGAGDTGTLEARPVEGGAALGSVALTNFADTVNLHIDTFADVLRARAGGQILSIKRGARAGGLCEIGAHDAAIRSLSVRGIEMVGFDFKTSAYKTFEDHIGSAGEPRTIAIGSGAESLATLMPRLGGEIDAAMTLDADDAERERIFNTAAAALAQPLRETTDRLHLDIAANGSERWLLLESPEPMDFVEEIKLILQRRVVIRSPFDFDLGRRIRDAITAVFERPPIFRLPVINPPRRFTLPWRGVFQKRRIGRALPTIEPRRLGAFSRRLIEERKPLVLAPNRPGKGTFLLTFDKDRLVVIDEATGKNTRFKPPKLTARDRTALLNTQIRFDRFGRIIEWLGKSRIEWHDTSLRVIQNAAKTKALLLPATSGALPNGQWRLSFNLTRKWFTTTDPVGPDNAYIAEAEINFDIT